MIFVVKAKDSSPSGPVYASATILESSSYFCINHFILLKKDYAGLLQIRGWVIKLMS
jgi:hypothetical protein